MHFSVSLKLCVSLCVREAERGLWIRLRFEDALWNGLVGTLPSVSSHCLAPTQSHTEPHRANGGSPKDKDKYRPTFQHCVCLCVRVWLFISVFVCFCLDVSLVPNGCNFSTLTCGVYWDGMGWDPLLLNSPALISFLITTHFVIYCSFFLVFYCPVFNSIYIYVLKINE